MALALDVAGLLALVAAAALLHLVAGLVVLGAALLVLSWRYGTPSDDEASL